MSFGGICAGDYISVLEGWYTQRGPGSSVPCLLLTSSNLVLPFGYS